MGRERYYKVTLSEEGEERLDYKGLNGDAKDIAERVGLDEYMENVSIAEIDCRLYIIGQLKEECSMDDVEDLESVDAIETINKNGF